MKQLKQKHNRAEPVIDFVDDCIVYSEEQDLSSWLRHVQKNQIIDIQEHFERYSNVFPVFGLNRAKHDLNLITFYLLPILEKDRDTELTVLKRANQFVSFKFVDIQSVDIFSFTICRHQIWRFSQKSFPLW